MLLECFSEQSRESVCVLLDGWMLFSLNERRNSITYAKPALRDPLLRQQ
jgi:hypothetical protein